VDRPPPPEALGSLLTHSALPCCTCAQVPKWGTTENNLLWVARIFHVPMTLMACLVAAWAYNPAYLLVVAFGAWKRWHVAHDHPERARRLLYPHPMLPIGAQGGPLAHLLDAFESQIEDVCRPHVRGARQAGQAEVLLQR
jgi:hypothetical protein